MPEDFRNRCHIGNALDVLRSLPSDCVQTCVTSPPYYGLRDYGHKGQIGLEATPYEYIDKLVEVFREVRRVLRPDGTFWLNIGDSYANDGKWGGQTSGKHAAGLHGRTSVGRARKHTGLKAKDLIGIPWRLAFALQDDGWWLRAENIWWKPNAMPESVSDRTTRSHEHIFMFAKSERYYYDADAIREPFESDEEGANPLGKNKRSVWVINPRPYKGAHFAVFPPELPEICIRAGTSEKGSCASCGAPYGRTLADWAPSCSCGAPIVPCVVLDPFAGSGTTLATAKWLCRDYLGVELNPEYENLIQGRIQPAEDTASERAGFELMLTLCED